MTDRRTAILEAAARTLARRGVRGLRVDELASEAGVSTALVYYHFKDRAGLLGRTLEFMTDRARQYTAGQSGTEAPTDPRGLLEFALLWEFQELPDVRADSTAWSELRAGAIFEPGLREALAKAGEAWIREVTELLALARPAAGPERLASSAERLTALREGLNARRLGGVLHMGHARALMREAIGVELSHLAHAAHDSGGTRTAGAPRVTPAAHASPGV
ncbi:TetR/AcrR family transcriptional regulator [Streptomyces showdoensis]|uniref:TetR/AcrR family transcriptional regulator n=1 Tax=Streptomyces showdoensis TaxID=68268 RepID=UPI001F0B247D|nr:TetR/AcrR family transcriptional regulator [Streptomyces showdoensis]